MVSPASPNYEKLPIFVLVQLSWLIILIESIHRSSFWKIPADTKTSQDWSVRRYRNISNESRDDVNYCIVKTPYKDLTISRRPCDLSNSISAAASILDYRDGVRSFPGNTSTSNQRWNKADRQFSSRLNPGTTKYTKYEIQSKQQMHCNNMLHLLKVYLKYTNTT